MNRIFAICLLLLATLLIGPAVAAQDGISGVSGVSFVQSVKVGDKFKISSEGTDVSTRKQVVAGNPQPDSVEQVRAKLSGVVEVIEIDTDGFATKVTIEVEEFTLVSSSGSTNPLGDKKALTIQRTESGMTFSDSEGELKGALVKSMLQLLFGMPSGDPDLQSFYATKERKNVGNTWSVKNDVLVKSLKDKGVEVDESTVGGACEIKSETEVEGISCFVVYGTIGAGQLKLPPEAAPKGMTIKDASFGSEFTATLPKDGITPMLIFENRASQEILMRGRMGKELILVEILAKIDRIVKRQIMPVKN